MIITAQDKYTVSLCRIKGEVEMYLLSKHIESRVDYHVQQTGIMASGGKRLSIVNRKRPWRNKQTSPQTLNPEEEISTLIAPGKVHKKSSFLFVEWQGSNQHCTYL